MNNTGKNIFPWEKRAALILLSTAAFFLVLFFIDYRWSNTSRSGGSPIGRIVYKNNVVQRKGKVDRIWSRVLSNSSLFNNDIIRADRLSDAEIFLNDGTQIKIEENSMFRLDLSDNEAQISFDRGAIRILQGDKSAQSLVVRAGGRQVELENSNVKIESNAVGKEKKSRELNVSVESGKAKILGQGQGGDRKEYIVGAQERAKLSSQSQGGGIVVTKLPVILEEPADQKVYLAKAGQAKVKFRWTAKKKLKQIKLEVSHSRSFKNKLHSLTIVKAKEFIFQPGVYYWRMRGLDSSGKKVESLTYKFEVTAEEFLRIFSPENKKTFRYVNQNPTIRFAWSNIERASQYEFSFAKDAKLQQDKRNLKLNVSDYSLKLDAGKYYWQVSALDQNGKTLSKSSLYRLGIQKTDSYIPPQAQAPRPGQRFAQTGLSDGLLFSWEAMEELEQFDFQLSRDRRFRNLVSRKSTSDNFVKIRVLLDPGTYYWRVRGKTKDKQKSPYGALYSFSIFKTEETQAEPEVVVDESKAIPEEGWTPPEFGVPEGLRNYTLEQYRKYIESLSNRCKKAGPPDLLIRKCFPTYVYLNLEGWHRLYLFYFLKMDNRNFRNRYQGYSFFSEKCDFRPAQELAQIYTQDIVDRSLEEKNKLTKLNTAFQNCKK